MALMIEDEAPLNIHGKYDRERKRKIRMKRRSQKELSEQELSEKSEPQQKYKMPSQGRRAETRPKKY